MQPYPHCCIKYRFNLIDQVKTDCTILIVILIGVLHKVSCRTCNGSLKPSRLEA